MKACQRDGERHQCPIDFPESGVIGSSQSLWDRDREGYHLCAAWSNSTGNPLTGTSFHSRLFILYSGIIFIHSSSHKNQSSEYSIHNFFSVHVPLGP